MLTVSKPEAMKRLRRILDELADIESRSFGLTHSGGLGRKGFVPDTFIVPEALNRIGAIKSYLNDVTREDSTLSEEELIAQSCAKYPRYTGEDTRCEKCGHNHAETDCSYGTHDQSHIPAFYLLLRKCERCGYRWAEKPLDAPEPKEKN